jgi:hypothetical protein
MISSRNAFFMMILALVSIGEVLMFAFTNPIFTSSSTKLSMAGGRSKEELGLSKRQMFRLVRDKLNQAATLPGFFEVGEGPAVSTRLLHSKLAITPYDTIGS